MPSVRGLRGATTIDVDEPEHITERMLALLTELFERNDIDHEDLISIVFTATDDIHSIFPAAAARKFGLGDVPLICARELDIEGATPRYLSVLIHLMTKHSRAALHHVYLRRARGLRNDLPE